MSAQLLRAAVRRPTAWKNGGGVTTEIAVAPAGADIAGFDWRISLAEVAQDGPFSLFPDVDRTLTVVSGDGIALQGLHTGPIRLTPASAPLDFPGDVSIDCSLIGGPITDLNVMTRRGRFRCEVTRLPVVDATITITAATMVILAAQPMTIRLGDGTKLALAGWDAAQIEDEVRLGLDAGRAGFLIGLHRTAS